MVGKTKKSARDSIASKKHSIVRDEILISAAQLFSERGYRAVTMDDIAAALEYTKSVVYYYFKNKNDILWQIFSRCVEKYSSDIEEIRSQDLPCEISFRKMIHRHAMNVMENPAWAAVYNGEESELTPAQRQQLSRMKRDYDTVFEAMYQRGVSEGLFREIPPHVAVSGILGMCNWLYAWFNPKGALKAEQIADHYTDLLAGGFRLAGN